MTTSLLAPNSARDGILPIGIRNLTVRIGGDVNFKIDDYDLDNNDLSIVIENARKIAREIYAEDVKGGYRLSASDDAIVDLVAASNIYVSAAMGYEALLKLADETYRNGKFFLIPGSPVLVASANGPTLAFDPSGGQLTISEKVSQAAWDYWVDQLCVIIKKQSAEIKNSQIDNTKSDLKRRWKRLADALIDKPVLIEAVVSRKDMDTYVIDGSDINAKYVSDRIQREFRGVPLGEEKTVVDEINADWILDNSAVIREIGSFVGALDTKSEEGRAALEDALKTYSTLNVHGFREHLRGLDTSGNKPDKIEAFIQDVKQIDPTTGEVTIIPMLMVPVDIPTNKRWATVQLSGRYTVVETQVAH